MSTQIAGSIISNVGTGVRSAEFIPASNFYITCSGGAVRLLVKIGTVFYGFGDVYQAQSYPTGGVSRAPSVPIGQALPVTIFESGATYVIEAVEPNTTASVWTI